MNALRASLSAEKAIGILAIVYTVGIAGTLIPIHEQFLLLTPLNLLFSITVVLAYHLRWNSQTWIFLLLCYAAGFGVEVLGVQSGVIFGEYSYGRTLGWKLWDTPLIIGLNWCMLVYCSGVVINHLMGEQPWWVKAPLAAALMTGLDVLIEPVAIRYDFWTWAGEGIPLQNYLAWYAIALVMLAVFYHIAPKTRNKVAVALFILQCLFFGILGLS
ncbi:MAG: carotenoid biosynthesis protein [Bacteroidota bacterium]